MGGRKARPKAGGWRGAGALAHSLEGGAGEVGDEVERGRTDVWENVGSCLGKVLSLSCP